MSIKKSIKAQIRKQLKSIRRWNLLTRKEKRSLAIEVLQKVIHRYNNQELPSVDTSEQLQLEPLPRGVMTLEQMRTFTKNLTTCIIPSYHQSKARYLSSELQAIDALLNNTVLNRLLAPEGYTPSKREKTPAMFFRAELLKSLHYAEMSYRKYCKREVNDLERKQNRIFIGLNLRRAEKIHHSELSAFRLSLTWKQQLNLLVYILTHFFDSPIGPGSFYYGIDGTDLAAKMLSHPLATITVNVAGREEQIAVYSQLDTECGERRNKSDRSKFFVGYKVHTLSVLNPLTGKAYSLLPVVSGANHHDSNFLKPLIMLGKALGLDIRLIVADQAYDCFDLSSFPEMRLVTPPRATVSLPENVTIENNEPSVYCHQLCETPMSWAGHTESIHEYHCSAQQGECCFELSCPRQREIPVDNGSFGHIPRTEPWIQALENTRKHCERPFNLVKHRNGIDRITVKSKRAVQSTAVIAVLLLEIVRYDEERYKVQKQIEIPLLAS